MVGSLEDLTASLTWVGHKATLVLVPHVAQQRALQIKDARAHCALELWALGRLAHGVD